MLLCVYILFVWVSFYNAKIKNVSFLVACMLILYFRFKIKAFGGVCVKQHEIGPREPTDYICVANHHYTKANTVSVQ